MDFCQSLPPSGRELRMKQEDILYVFYVVHSELNVSVAATLSDSILKMFLLNGTSHSHILLFYFIFQKKKKKRLFSVFVHRCTHVDGYRTLFQSVGLGSGRADEIESIDADN